jgi:hypothetical protein
MVHILKGKKEPIDYDNTKTSFSMNFVWENDYFTFSVDPIKKSETNVEKNETIIVQRNETITVERNETFIAPAHPLIKEIETVVDPLQDKQSIDEQPRLVTITSPETPPQSAQPETPLPETLPQPGQDPVTLYVQPLPISIHDQDSDTQQLVLPLSISIQIPSLNEVSTPILEVSIPEVSIPEVSIPEVSIQNVPSVQTPTAQQEVAPINQEESLAVQLPPIVDSVPDIPDSQTPNIQMLEVQVQEVQVQEIQVQEIQVQEVQVQEIQVQEMNVQEHLATRESMDTKKRKSDDVEDVQDLKIQKTEDELEDAQASMSF